MQVLAVTQDQHHLKDDTQHRDQWRGDLDANHRHQQRHTEQRRTKPHDALNERSREGDEGNENKLGGIHGLRRGPGRSCQLIVRLNSQITNPLLEPAGS